MRITTNSQAAHEFFYANAATVNSDYTFGTQCSFGTNCWSDSENIILNFYSYHTKVAMLYRSSKDNNIYLLINWSSMTPTTGKHLSHLRSANPYYKTINVPFLYGEYNTSLQNIIQHITKELKYYTDQLDLLYKKANRTYFEELKQAANDIEELLGEDTGAAKEYIKIIDNFINNDKFIQMKKQLAAAKAAITREENKEKREQEKQQIQELKTKYSYYEMILACCDSKSDFYKNTDYDTRDFISSKILHCATSWKQKNLKYNALIWIDTENDCVRTSKYITVDKKQAFTLLKLWHNGKLRHGMTLDKYTVLEVMPDYVKIGCHKIPAENLQALWEEMTQNKKMEGAA